MNYFFIPEAPQFTNVPVVSQLPSVPLGITKTHSSEHETV